jgi:hypothetical protein
MYSEKEKDGKNRSVILKDKIGKVGIWRLWTISKI